MPSRRKLKKAVGYALGELLTEAMVFKAYIPKVDVEKADLLMNKIIKTNDEFIKRISHTEPGSVKLFYKKFGEDFNTAIDEILEDLNSLNGQS
ncbi:MAG: hypothetical protein WCR36_02415 [Bacteroidaceae bacterium]